jgi:hypothetical protein
MDRGRNSVVLAPIVPDAKLSSMALDREHFRNLKAHLEDQVRRENLFPGAPRIDRA